MAYEAMNNAAYLNTKVVVVLNDNGQVSLPTGTQSAGGVAPAGALSAYTSRLLTSKPFLDFRSFAKSFSSLLPEEIQAVNKRIDAFTRGALQGGTLFEELGFYYVGPVDGHDLSNLVPILENIRDRNDDKPVLLHVSARTRGGRGRRRRLRGVLPLPFADARASRLHAAAVGCARPPADAAAPLTRRSRRSAPVCRSRRRRAMATRRPWVRRTSTTASQSSTCPPATSTRGRRGGRRTRPCLRRR